MQSTAVGGEILIQKIYSCVLVEYRLCEQPAAKYQPHPVDPLRVLYAAELAALLDELKMQTFIERTHEAERIHRRMHAIIQDIANADTNHPTYSSAPSRSGPSCQPSVTNLERRIRSVVYDAIWLYDDASPNNINVYFGIQKNVPWSIMASATFTKPAMLAPRTSEGSCSLVFANSTDVL